MARRSWIACSRPCGGTMPERMREETCDVLVIGSGIAGLSYALKASQHGDVVLVTKKQRAQSSTNYAQGGIAAVWSDDDSIELHARDTFVAGAGLCHTSAVRMLVEEGPARVRELIDWGVRFTQEQETVSLGREGGHSVRRILHAGDLTGREIERALLSAVAAEPRITLLEDHLAVDLLVRGTPPRCAGAIVLDHRTGTLTRYNALVVLLATGGMGQAWLHTTNPDIATGDGVAMAYRAGAQVANLEFMQFHPTALDAPDGSTFLISEAVRGEGAILRTPEGAPLMEGVHPLGSLAPRDIVARAIDTMMKQTGAPHALLGLSPIPAERIETRFPGSMKECAARGFDIRREPIPVVPAAHYACGGIRTDANGRTSLRGLFAAGEVACTGVHGANRLASNSLLEAVVYSHRAAQALPVSLAQAARTSDGRSEPGAPLPRGRERDGAWQAVRASIRQALWEDVGLVRTDARLGRAARRLEALRAGMNDGSVRDPEYIEVRNLLEVAELVVRSARLRRESRGLHHNTDDPYRDNERELRDTVLERAWS